MKLITEGYTQLRRWGYSGRAADYLGRKLLKQNFNTSLQGHDNRYSIIPMTSPEVHSSGGVFWRMYRKLQMAIDWK